jgi:hypothetical protein
MPFGLRAAPPRGWKMPPGAGTLLMAKVIRAPENAARRRNGLAYR